MLEDLVELLDRQWNFLLTLEGTAFHRQLRRFVRFLQEEPRLASLINDIKRDGDELIRQHRQHDQTLTQNLVALKNEFTKQLPDEDDSSMPLPISGWPTLDYEMSFAKFDTIASSPSDHSVRVDDLTDNTKPKKLLRVFESKF